jgi:DNA-binding protein H-NS
VRRKRDGDFTALSMADLMALRDRVVAEIESRRKRDERSMVERGGLVERDGPRYRNPTNPSETWSGRGPQPEWLENLLAKGADLEALKVQDDRPVKGGE